MTTDALLVRGATSYDAPTIAEFNTALALESEGIELDPETLRAGVQVALSDPRKTFYLMATRGAYPVGQLMVTHEWSDWRNGWIWWVQSVYVRPEHRRQGIYRALYSRLREIAVQRGDIRGIRLYVLRSNHIAKQTYQALGMSHSEYDLYASDADFPQYTPPAPSDDAAA